MPSELPSVHAKGHHQVQLPRCHFPSFQTFSLGVIHSYHLVTTESAWKANPPNSPWSNDMDSPYFPGFAAHVWCTCVQSPCRVPHILLSSAQLGYRTNPRPPSYMSHTLGHRFYPPTGEEAWGRSFFCVYSLGMCRSSSAISNAKERW